MSSMKSESEKLTKKHPNLTHSEMMKVTSHVQRESGQWIVNTIMVEGCEAPFRYKRKQLYKKKRSACKFNLLSYNRVNCWHSNGNYECSEN